MALDIKNVYTSVACNRSAYALDWGYNGLICYAAHNAIIIYDEKANSGMGEVTHTLVNHTAPVYCVRWIRKEPEVPEDELISVSVDKTAVIWKKENNFFTVVCALVGHDATIMVGAGIYVLQQADQYQQTYFATASADSTIKLWKRSSEGVKYLQTISLGRGFALDLQFSTLPGTNDPFPILAMAGDDSKIHLYCQTKDNKFHEVLSLIGHEDWVRGISFAVDDKGDLLLASCSQDTFLRIWRIAPRGLEPQQAESDAEDVKEIKLKETLFIAATSELSYTFAVTLDSVLTGHENWVYSVRWEPVYSKDGCLKQPMRLLTASMDKTMILWEPDETTGVWTEKVRVGEVGGNTLGFYGAVFGIDGKSILAHGYQGAFHLWQYKEDTDKWEPGVTIGGHFDEVSSVEWDPQGRYLLSCSTDQTTRLHAPWVQDSEKSAWHEIGRPQVHGYDMNCLAVVDHCRFVSAADEKIARVFEAPRNFIENFKNICGVSLAPTEGDNMPEGASVPALGLSNKAVFDKDLQNSELDKQRNQKETYEYPDFYFLPVTLTAPPAEELLLQNTLWPEVQKLYGHGYEVYSVCANHSGTLVATSCKASKEDHADIVLWETSNWKQINRLKSHTLTVTQMAFSPDDNFLLSVSRDRTWAVFGAHPEEISKGSFVRVAHSDKKNGMHSRIIWTCAWSHDGKYFATGSRDKKVVIWGKHDEEGNSSSTLGAYYPCLPALELENSSTAVAFAPCPVEDRYLVVVGLENGIILLYTWREKETSSDCWQLCSVLTVLLAHHLAIKRVVFSPVLGNEGTTLQMASCGSDNFVRVYTITLNV